MNDFLIYEDGTCYVNNVEVEIYGFMIEEVADGEPTVTVTMPVKKYSVRNSNIGLE